MSAEFRQFRHLTLSQPTQTTRRSERPAASNVKSCGTLCLDGWNKQNLRRLGRCDSTSTTETGLAMKPWYCSASKLRGNCF